MLRSPEPLPAHVHVEPVEDHVAFQTAAICPGCGARIWALCKPVYRRKTLRVMDLSPLLWTSRNRDSWKSTGVKLLPVSTRCTLGGSCVFSLGDARGVREYLDSLPPLMRAGLPLSVGDVRDACRNADIRAMHAARVYVQFLGAQSR